MKRRYCHEVKVDKRGRSSSDVTACRRRRGHPETSPVGRTAGLSRSSSNGTIWAPKAIGTTRRLSAFQTSSRQDVPRRFGRASLYSLPICSLVRDEVPLLRNAHCCHYAYDDLFWHSSVGFVPIVCQSSSSSSPTDGKVLLWEVLHTAR